MFSKNIGKPFYIYISNKEINMSDDLNKIIEGINSENYTDWLEGYAEKLETEGSNKILVLDINKTDLANEKNKTRGKKNWQSMGFKTYLEYRQHLAKKKERDEE